jgi:hypothetical protein
MTVAVDRFPLHDARGALPKWVRLLDAAALGLLILAVLLIAGDGVRFALGPVRVSIVSAARVAMWAAILIAARHAFYRTPPLPARVIAWLRTGVAWADVRFAAVLLLATRIPPILIGLLAVATIGIGTPVGYQPYENPLLNLPARWDAIWYTQIAAFGYTFDGNPLRQQSIVFFPGFPMAIHVVNRFMGGHLFYAAWVVALSAFTLAILRFLRLARHHLGERAATDSVWLLASYPFAVYYSAAYSEGLFLLAVCAVFLAMHEQRFGSAALWGLAAGLTRPNGWLLTIPIVLLAFYRQPWPTTAREWLRRAMPVAAPAAGTLLFTVYLYFQFGDGFVWIEGQQAWGRVYRGLHLFAADRLLYIRDTGLVQYLFDQPIDVLNTAAALLALALVWPISRRLGPAYGALVAVMVLPPLLMGGSTSIGRMTSVLFPIFIWLAERTERHRTPILVVFATLQGFAAVLFFTWRELY